MMIKNPLTGRSITVGGKVYKKLVDNGVLQHINDDSTTIITKTTKKKRIIWPIVPQPELHGFTTIVDHRGALVRYYPRFIKNPKKSFIKLLELVKYSKNERRLFAPIDAEPAKRKTLQVADTGIRLYRYSSSATESTMNWENFPILVNFRKKIFEEIGIDFNFALINIYEPGVNLGWHSDDENDMVPNSTIFSLSFGAERWFDMEELPPKNPNSTFVPIRKRILLTAGSAITMEKECQKVFKHRVPPFKTDKTRINITFRVMKKEDTK